MTPHPPGTPTFRAAFLAPRHWSLWCRLLLLRVVMRLPRRWVMALGGALGDQLRTRNHKRRRIAEINLALCFPQMSAAQRRLLLVAHFRQYGRSLLDMGLVLWASPARIDRLCRLRRGEWLARQVRRRPVILVAFHQTALDMGGAILARHHPVVAMMKRDRSALLTWQLWKGRTHLAPANIRLLMRDQGLRPLLRLLVPGRVCQFTPDEDFGRTGQSVFAPFFGVPASTLTVVSRLAKLSGALVIPVATALDATSGEYEMTMAEPLADFPSGDLQADAVALNQAMETLIRQAPEQYMWTFRWFRTQPGGGVSPYI